MAKALSVAVRGNSEPHKRAYDRLLLQINAQHFVFLSIQLSTTASTLWPASQDIPLIKCREWSRESNKNSPTVRDLERVFFNCPIIHPVCRASFRMTILHLSGSNQGESLSLCQERNYESKR